MRTVRRGLGAALFVAALVVGWTFARRNAQPVDVSYVFGRVEGVALWAALLGAFGVGVVVTGALALYSLAKLRLLARHYRKAAADLEAEVHELRNLPLVGGAAAGDAGEGGSRSEARARSVARGV